MSGQTAEEIEAEIEVQREQLAGTLDALTTKLDVKSQARAKVSDVRATTRTRMSEARTTTQAKVAVAKDRMTTGEGRPRPELLAAAAAVVVAAGVTVWWRQR